MIIEIPIYKASLDEILEEDVLEVDIWGDIQKVDEGIGVQGNYTDWVYRCIRIDFDETLYSSDEIDTINKYIESHYTSLEKQLTNELS